ncbi:DUF3941 domain-containing protein [Evansella tamaricis]|uniref:DUF3941 domain-containing protein n=1 Tax=Evansella tamaricis TaxID=2069301 RepID=A0ABS6JCT0_9BACI|nr:DUF3941 domain-containing protein [Evansella tamaricis]MBU9711466.1 DUF3941 domain-containing protein [Evansella tamaricis]
MDPTKDNNKRPHDNQALNEHKNERERENKQKQPQKKSYSKKTDHL